MSNNFQGLLILDSTATATGCIFASTFLVAGVLFSTNYKSVNGGRFRSLAFQLLFFATWLVANVVTSLPLPHITFTGRNCACTVNTARFKTIRIAHILSPYSYIIQLFTLYVKKILEFFLVVIALGI
jgi:hypothetical protein